MSVMTGQGVRFFIGPANEVADNASDYNALSYTEVGEVRDLGEYGDQWDNTTFTALNDSRVRKIKTVKNAGDPALAVGMDGGDAGQAALLTAFDSTSDYAVKIEFNDASEGSPSEPTKHFFRAKIMSKRVAGISNTDVIIRNVQLAINSDLIEVANV